MARIARRLPTAGEKSKLVDEDAEGGKVEPCPGQSLVVGEG